MAQGISFVLCIAYLKRKDFIFDFKLKSFKIRRDKLIKILRIGFPSAMQMTLTSLSFLTVSSLINDFGVLISSGTAVGQKIDSFAILPGLAFSSAISAMVGQNIGAREFDRAKHTAYSGLIINIIVSVVMAGAINLIPGQLVRLFDDTPEVIEYGIMYLRYSSIHYAIVSIVFAVNGLANGTGNTMYSFVNSLLNSIVMRVGLSYAFVLSGMGVKGIYLAVALSPVLSATVSMVFLFTGRWKKAKIMKKINRGSAGRTVKSIRALSISLLENKCRKTSLKRFCGVLCSSRQGKYYLMSTEQ
jgi:Na+-driven multidrug efflux pump